MARIHPTGGVAHRLAPGRLAPIAGDWLVAAFAAERVRWPLWIPVLFGGGIAFYFAFWAEPPPSIAVAALSLSTMFVAAFRRRPGMRLAGCAALVMAVGFAAAQLRTHLVAAPVIEKRLPNVAVEGRVRIEERRPEGRRLTLDRLTIGRLAPERTPAKVRISLRQVEPAFRPGDVVRLRAVLYPPPGPAAPGAFDYGRYAWFERLGAVGYAVSRAEAKARAPDGIAIAIEDLRQRLTTRIHAALPGATGGVAAALMTGDRGAIPEDVNAAMQDSGLAHLLSISGLHMGLVAGLLFFVIRFGMAALERPVLRWPAKKWAAVATLVGASCYLLISGMSVPTQRSFLMLGLVLVAVLIDRQPISMNLVAWAAGAILLVSPESLLNASFQMSFAAVIALIAAYEVGAARLAGRGRDGRWPRPLVYVGTVAITTIIAGLATAPFAAYHFNRVALYSLLANLLAVPLAAVWVMPCAVLAFLLMPLGLEGAPLAAMGWGVDATIWIARWIQAMPGSATLVPSMPPLGLVLIAIGGLWLCLWYRPWRLFGVAPIVAGLATVFFVHTPDVMIDDTGKAFAVRGPDSGMVLVHARGMTAETWLRRAAQKEPASKIALGGARFEWLRCDSLGCIYRHNGEVVALVRSPAALADDCPRATVLIASVPVRRYQCRGPRVIIDRWQLWREGPHALWLERDGVRVKSVRDVRGDRPWSPLPGRRRTAAQ